MENYKEIPLINGGVAIVDTEDYEWLSQWKWHMTSEGYARRGERINGQFHDVMMHREINKTPKGECTDHINRDKLDNRRANLRTASKEINSLNAGMFCTNKSGVKGVVWNKDSKKWVVQKKFKGKNIHFGYFKDFNEAAAVAKIVFQQFYERAVREYSGAAVQIFDALDKEVKQS